MLKVYLLLKLIINSAIDQFYCFYAHPEMLSFVWCHYYGPFKKLAL